MRVFVVNTNRAAQRQTGSDMRTKLCKYLCESVAMQIINQTTGNLNSEHEIMTNFQIRLLLLISLVTKNDCQIRSISWLKRVILKYKKLNSEKNKFVHSSCSGRSEAELTGGHYAFGFRVEMQIWRVERRVELVECEPGASETCFKLLEYQNTHVGTGRWISTERYGTVVKQLPHVRLCADTRDTDAPVECHLRLNADKLGIKAHL